MIDLKSLIKLTKKLNILYVEDDEYIQEALTAYLKKLFNKIDTALNGRDALELYKLNQYDIVITDIQMPILSGIELTKKIKEIDNEQTIIISSAYSDNQYFLEAIKLGVDAYILKPIDYELLNSAFYKVATKIKKYKEHSEYKKDLEVLLTELSSENLLQKIKFSDNYEKTLFALIEIIEKRDTYTGQHSLRVAKYSKMIAAELGFDKDDCEKIYKAGILHDLGKIAIPDSLLLKPGKLKELEYNLIKEHVSIGFHMLDKIPMFKDIARIINSHHERLDGSGYPNGLKEDQIPFESNIMAVADTFDAMTTSRIYKEKMTISEALTEIKKLSNIYFKEQIVNAATNVLKDIRIDININQLPQTNLEEERFSYFYKDNLTEVYNEKYLDLILAKNVYEKKYKFINLILIDGFGDFNKKNGWLKGNDLLINLANELKTLSTDGLIFRVHGDNFIVIGINKECKNILEEKTQIFLSTCDPNMKIQIMSFNIYEKNINSITKLESYL